MGLLAACGGSEGTADTGGGAGADAGVPRAEDTGGGAGRDAGAATPDAAAAMCTNTALFADADEDDYGVASLTMQACLLPGERRAGYSRRSGDCAPADPWRHPGASEICGDFVDDDCVGGDQPCPTTQPAGLEVPAWDCTSGPAPSNVYAYALFSDGRTYFRPNGCFVFFEGQKDEFYVKRTNFERARTDASCTSIDGCTCPSNGGWPSYDRRLYAFTLRGEAGACPKISLVDHGGMSQPVSNDCRKYLFQLHYYDIPYSYVAGSLEALQLRLSLFPKVEIACAEDSPHQNLPYTTLLTAPIQVNPGFAKK